MACAYGWLADDCALGHWCPPTGGRRDGGRYRAPCPVPVCHASRALQFWPAGRQVAWRSWCADHDRAATYPELHKLVGECVSLRAGTRPAVRPDELAALAHRDLPASAYRIELLRMSGMSAQQARADLKLAKQTYYDAMRALGGQ